MNYRQILLRTVVVTMGAGVPVGTTQVQEGVEGGVEVIVGVGLVLILVVVVLGAVVVIVETLLGVVVWMVVVVVSGGGGGGT